MKSILSSAVLAVASFAILATPAYGQDETDGQPTANPADGLTTIRTQKNLGCFSDPGSMINMGPYTFQTVGWCQDLCIRLAKPFMALTNGTTCLCGDSAPSGNQIDSNSCNQPCAGFNQQTCGGNGAFAVFNDGYQPGDPTGSAQIKIPSATPGPSTDGSSPSSSQTLVVSTALVTQSGGQTVPTVIRVTETAQASSPSGGSNKVAIAVGIVIAVVAVAAVVGALFFWMRHRKNKAIEEERSRHQMMTNLVTGEKPGSSYSMGDSRLDQSVMFQRRQSDGSIADNEDYSRRILKVTNPE